MHLYLSFVRIDEPYALQFANILTRDHTLAYDDRLFIRNWWQRTLVQLDSCDALLYFISPEGAAAEYCRRECEVMQQAGRAVIPILIVDGAPVLTMLEDYTMLDFRAGITAEGEAALRAVLAAVEVDKTQPVYGVEAAQRPLEVTKDDPGALITEANQEAFEEKWERVVYLLRSALATGFTSELVNVRGLLSDAEIALMEARHERQGAIAYRALRHEAHTYKDREQFRSNAHLFAQTYPGYDPDMLLAQIGIPVVYPPNRSSTMQPAILDDMSPARRWSTSDFDLGLVFDYVKSILNPRGDSGRLVLVVLVIGVFVGLAYQFRPTAPRNQAPEAILVAETRLVQGGCFEMGSNNYRLSERPAHTVCVGDFSMDRYEVSYGQFLRWRGTAQEPNAVSSPNYPRTNITWTEAQVFCQQRNARLPTEAEWEYAASDQGQYTFPWGNVFDVSKVHSNVQNTSFVGAIAVNAHSGHATTAGIVNLSGNVAEWVSSAFAPYPYNMADGRESSGAEMRVIRGGSYLTSPQLVRAASRDSRMPSYTSDDVGFRCARDA